MSSPTHPSISGDDAGDTRPPAVHTGDAYRTETQYNSDAPSWYGAPPFGASPPPSGPQPPYAAAPAWGAVPFGLPAAAPPRRRRRLVTGFVAAGAAAALVATGFGVGWAARPTSTSSATSSVDQPAVNTGPGSGSTGSGSGSAGSGSGSSGSGSGSGSSGSGSGSSGSGSTGSGSGSSSTSTAGTTAATSAQSAGVVTVDSILKYQGAEAEGTGTVLTADGEILTNNHVIDGATSITVTVVSTGTTYTATVVGTDATDDIAVLQLRNASGLTTADYATTAEVAALGTGSSVTGVGNAGGTGSLLASAGTVTALNQSITATDESGQNSEKLTGLIQTDANIISGDSGGPLYDSAGNVVGIDTAGSSGSASGSATVSTTYESYAIPITTALAIADKIEAGQASSTIHIGTSPFLGVELSQDGGLTVQGVVTGTPAATAGITAGSTITAVGSTAVSTSAGLSEALGGYEAGQRASITWTDAAGAAHTATVTLIAGPAD